jgi:hypothetical protein
LETSLRCRCSILSCLFYNVDWIFILYSSQFVFWLCSLLLGVLWIA